MTSRWPFRRQGAVTGTTCFPMKFRICALGVAVEGGPVGTVGSAANVAGTAGQSDLDGTPVTSTQLDVSAAGEALSSLGGSAISIMAGDSAQASTQGASVNMRKAPVNSPTGVGIHKAATTASSRRVGWLREP